MRYFLLLLFIYGGFLKAQLNYGLYGGLSVSFGNKQNRIGLTGGGYVYYNYIQLNLKATGFYNFKSIGVEKHTPEVIIGMGLVGAFGKKDSSKVMFNTLVDNNTNRQNSLGYAWKYYFDKQNTSQSTGVVMLGVNKIQISTENDLFGGKSGLDDRFRTGAFRISYQLNNWQYTWKHIFYTGNFDESNKIKNRNYPSRFGYYSDENSTYSDKSLGISAFEIEYKLPYQQVVSASVGIDSEWIRFGFQNWLIHDSYYIPKKWIKYQNLHIPPVDKKGNQFLFKNDQKIKPTTIYFGVGLNEIQYY